MTVQIVPTGTDLEISSAAFGAYIVMALFTAHEAVKHTKRMKRPHRSLFVWMVWVQILATLGLSITSFLCIRQIWLINHGSLWSVIIFWAIEIHMIMQIILNRLTIIAPNKKFMFRLKITMLVVLLLINVSVIVIWIPARLEVSETWLKINHVWDPFEISLVIFLDMLLNVYFIYIVKKVLLAQGLKKYGKLITVNSILMLGSLLIDILMISAMFVSNPMLYLQIFPLAYIIKTRIELEMASCILRIAQSSTNIDVSLGLRSESNNTSYNATHRGDRISAAVPLSPRPFGKSPSPFNNGATQGTTQPRTVTSDIVGGVHNGGPNRFSHDERGVHVQKDVFSVVEEDYDIEKGVDTPTSASSSVRELVEERNAQDRIN